MPEWKRANTDWFQQAGWGVFVHYLASVEMTADEWNRRVDDFNAESLASQLESVGAPYLFLTIGQCSGHYCSPNVTYDNIVGQQPSKCSRRDLISDLSETLTQRGIQLLVYHPSHPPTLCREVVEAFRFTPDWDASQWGLRPGSYLRTVSVDSRLTEAQQNWEAVTREWSLRWGQKVKGWWVDGCYYADKMYRHSDAPNFASFATAMKAGNPDALIAFNPGVKTPVISYTEYEDYTAGELAGDLPLGTWTHPDRPKYCHYGPTGRWVDGAQYHVLSFLGEWWSSAPPRFPTELVAGYTHYISAHEGVITWDVPTDSHGLIPKPFLEQLAAVGKRRMR